jgi:hypothetical protein
MAPVHIGQVHFANHRMHLTAGVRLGEVFDLALARRR